MPQYAKFETKAAWLGTTFGESYARRLFGDAVVNALPRYVRGKNAGKFKAEVAWVKCVEGGWINEGSDVMRGEATGRVENRSGKVLTAVLRARETGNIATHGEPQYVRMLDAV